ncbi:MAG: hypothetical protein AAF552_18475 [Pseudomonadota bacterium]
MNRVGLMVFLGFVLAGCQTVPSDPNQLPLEASEGVKAYFEPGADKAEAAANIRCEKRRKTGTRMTKRVCRTKDEVAGAPRRRVLHRWREVDAALNGGG